MPHSASILEYRPVSARTARHAIARQRHGHVPAGHATHQCRRYLRRVRERLVVQRRQPRNELQRIARLNVQLRMLVPRCSATARACCASSNRASSNPIVKVLIRRERPCLHQRRYGRRVYSTERNAPSGTSAIICCVTARPTTRRTASTASFESPVKGGPARTARYLFQRPIPFLLRYALGFHRARTAIDLHE